MLSSKTEKNRAELTVLVKFVNERGGVAIIPGLETPPKEFDSLENVFQLLLEHELVVTDSINNLVDVCLQEKDYSTHNFIQWYVSEQLEEEALARNILDKIKLIGDDKGGFYLFDNDIKLLITAANKA